MKFGLAPLAVMLALALAMGMTDAGCDGRSGPESLATSSDHVTVPDTPELWHEFVTVTDWHVSLEKKGEKPPGGLESWAEHWSISIREMKKSQENHEKYVNYIIGARSRAGLPKLHE